MAEVIMLVLRVVHIFCGVFWAGGALIVAGFLGPAVRNLGPDGGKVMQQLVVRRRFGLFMTLAGDFTVLTGLAFLGHNMANAMWRASTYGQVMMIGSAAGVVALGIGHAVNAPTAKKLAARGAAAQAAGTPPSPAQLAEVAALQKRLQTGAVTVAILTSIAVVAMASASQL
jgi:uncharacterized membrane protein